MGTLRKGVTGKTTTEVVGGKRKALKIHDEYDRTIMGGLVEHQTNEITLGKDALLKLKKDIEKVLGK
jgi:hypothetical protein